MSAQDVALGLTEFGFAVFPLWWPRAPGRCACLFKCGSPAKHPIGLVARDGVHDATADRTIIEAWWRRFPNANIGIACGEISGFWALDIDPDKDGEASLATLIERHGPLPATPSQRTGGGGRHILFRHNERIKNRASHKPLGSGLDTRGNGGYIVAPGSVHETGALYEWLASPRDVPIATAPEWLVELACKEPEIPFNPGPRTHLFADSHGPDKSSRYGGNGLQGEIERLYQATVGDRNNTLNISAFKLGRLIAGGELNEEVVKEELQKAARDIGLIEREIMPTINSGINNGKFYPRFRP